MGSTVPADTKCLSASSDRLGVSMVVLQTNMAALEVLMDAVG